MAVEKLPIFSYFNRQRFTQFGSMDCANWYGVSVEDTKKGQALYPSMGRKHLRFFGENKLVFDSEPSQIFTTINFLYVIVGTSVIQINSNYEQKVIGNVPLGSTNWFDFLPVGDVVYGILTAQTTMFLITENSDGSVTFQQITDPNAPKKPYFVAAFGLRFVVSNQDTPDFFLTNPNLVDSMGNVDPNTIFTVNGASLFGRASGVIGQLGVLHNQLYMFSDFTTDVFADIPTQITIGGITEEFPIKRNTSYNFDYGIKNPYSLSIDFGMMVWEGNNRNGLVSFMVSNGGAPKPISSQAINVVLQNSTNSPDDLSPFLQPNQQVNGFLYQFENTIFYRVSAGNYFGYGDVDVNQTDAYTFEFNFSTQTWTRTIELNGERNRIQKHVYFNNLHLVSVLGDNALYQMAGNIYVNEVRTAGTNPQDMNAFTAYPFRQELVTQQLFQEDYSEFLTSYVEIDFVFGFGFYKSDAPFANTVFIITEDAASDGGPVFCIAEDAAPDGSPVFLIIEGTNFPTLNDIHFNSLFKPHIELFYSDDGGVTFTLGTADVRPPSEIGKYTWRFRWYELGVSRNRCYKLVCVSPVPVVVLGAVQDVMRVSGGAN